jgi:hypothetical protein
VVTTTGRAKRFPRSAQRGLQPYSRSRRAHSRYPPPTLADALLEGGLVASRKCESKVATLDLSWQELDWGRGVRVFG